MQLPTWENEAEIKQFRTTLSEARLARYLGEANGDFSKAIEYYFWNTELSKSLYGTLQMWEVALRNRLNSFLCWKYTAAWPYDNARALRQLTSNERRKVADCIDRQKQIRGISQIPTDALVADLSAGFWVALLNASYDVPFAWRYNLRRVFPHDASLDRLTASELCSHLLDLRNRVAHHEPIYHLKLADRRKDLSRVLGAMCPAAERYATAICTVDAVLNQRHK